MAFAKPDIYLIDGNSIGYASHMAMKLSVNGTPTQAVFGVIKAVRELAIRAPNAKIFVLWDGKAVWRQQIFPLYKSGRTKRPEQLLMREEYKRQSPDIRAALKHLGVDQVISPLCEADDLAATYAHAFSTKGWNVRLITADRDWIQLVNKNTDWFDPIHDKHCTDKNFYEFTGYKNVTQFVDDKALKGDTSDDIGGVGGIGEKNAQLLIGQFGSVKKFLATYDKDPDAIPNLPKPWMKLGENIDQRRDLYHRNIRLMRLIPNAPGVDKRTTIKGEFNQEEFKRLCEDMAFLSITSRLDQWIEPFKQRQKVSV